MFHQWSGKLFCTKNQLQSLPGSLVYVSKCVNPARQFLNRMSTLLREKVANKKVKLTESFKDLT